MYPAKNERVNESDICHFFSLMWPLLIYEYELVIFTQILGIAEFQKKNVLLCKYRGVITTKATKAAALVDFWDYKKWHKQLGRFEEKNIFIFPKQKNSLNILFFFLQDWNDYHSTKKKIFLNILGLLCRIEEKNIFIFLTV